MPCVETLSAASALPFESIQAEDGVVVPEDGYMTKIKERLIDF